MTRWAIPILVLLFVPRALAQSVDERAEHLAARLIAPCCWNETLDTHASPLATELRLEIRERLAAGERETAIEEDLVARYGERVRAIPREGEPLAIGIMIAMALALVLLVALGLRWVRASRRDRAKEAAPAPSATYDARLEAELEAVDDA